MSAHRFATPVIDAEVQRMAEQVAAAWPPLSEEQRAKLAAILAPTTNVTARRPVASAFVRRAA